MKDPAAVIRRLRRAADVVRALPVHPQWLMRRASVPLLGALSASKPGDLVVDIGCGHRWPERALPDGCRYVGIDHPQTATEWYASRPDIFADAAALPLASGSVDCVLLLDVIEHLRDPGAALDEATRVLRPGGRVLLRVPFAYPLHDEPLDFRRWTQHGLAILAKSHGFRVETIVAHGTSLQTATLLLNLAFAKTVVSALGGHVGHKLAGLALAPFALLAITAGNLLAAALARITPADRFLPYSYTLILQR